MTSTAGNTGVKRTLDSSFINDLLSESRTRGDYDVILDDFHASGEAGIEVDLSAGTLVGKDAANVYQGLNNAKKKQDKDGNLVRLWGPTIKVIKKNMGGSGKEGEPARDDHIFLINTSLVEGVSPESETDEPADNEGTEQ